MDLKKTLMSSNTLQCGGGDFKKFHKNLNNNWKKYFKNYNFSITTKDNFKTLIEN